MDSCPGTITVEYYDGSSDFSSDSGGDGESECPTRLDHHHSPSSSPCSSASSQNVRDSISCKTYDFKHSGSEAECNNNEPRGGKVMGQKIFPDLAREAMSGHYSITHQEHKESLLHPKASFPRCPRGDVPEQYGRRKHPGPFLTCSFSHSHECGDDFLRIPIPTKPTPEFDTFTRPQHLKEKKAKFFKQCKHCETIGFTHHRNPASHYEDYLNNVTYKQHNEHTKVWQQHLVDRMFIMGEDSNTFYADEDIIEKCKHFKPCESIVKATRYSRHSQRRISTVITRKRTAIVRPLRRPLHKTNAPKVSSLTNSTPRAPRSSLPEQKRSNNNILSRSESAEVHQRKHSKERANHLSCHLDQTARRRSARGRRKSEELHLQSIRRRSSSERDDINKNGRQQCALHQRLKASVTRLINSRHASSKISKRFVKKAAEPPKEVKYVQRGKPNISAKFLRTRSKNKLQQSTATTHDGSPQVGSPTTSSHHRNKGKSSINSKKHRSAQAKIGRAFGKRQTQGKSSSSKDEDSSDDDGSYAQYRDQNGEFDVEKYRQSILKMLTKNTGKGTTEKKKKLKRSSQLSQSSFLTLPKVRNVYRDVKPRITSNFTQRKRRKVRKLKRDSEFDFQVPSDVSFKSKYWNDDSLASKESYFSIPSVHEL